jgi:diguanylate cyclase (GGDEF)-like protein
MRNPTDLCARYGGEEFCIMLPETDQKGALIVAERILKSISETNINVENFSRQITVSIGLYTRVPDRLVKASDYLKLADKALYKAKENGRNRVEVYLDPRDS